MNMVQYSGGLSKTLKQANAYSDSGFAQAVSQAEGYTDQQLNNLGQGTGSLKRDAFSGIAAPVSPWAMPACRRLQARGREIGFFVRAAKLSRSASIR